MADDKYPLTSDILIFLRKCIAAWWQNKHWRVWGPVSSVGSALLTWLVFKHSQDWTAQEAAREGVLMTIFLPTAAVAFMAIWIFAAAPYILYRRIREERDQLAARCETLEEREKPRLKLEWDRAITGCEKNQRTVHGRESRWFRIRMFNAGGIPLEDCRVSLAAIRKDSESEPRWGGDKLQLPFAQENDVFVKTIHAGAEEFVDVAMAVKDDKLWRLGSLNRGWSFQPALESIFADTGDYALEIRVSSVSLSAQTYWLGIHFDSHFNEWPFITGIEAFSQSGPAAASSRRS
jgi:hypothetical protein